MPRKYFVTEGVGVSRVSPLNAFDRALRDAGIAHLNLVPVSSIIPKNAIEVKPERIPPGAITFVIMAKAEGQGGERIAAGLAWARGEDHGYVVEGHGRSGREVKEQLIEMMREVASDVKLYMDTLKIRVRELRVPEGAYGCVVVVLVLL